MLVLWSGYCLLSVKCVFSSSCACDQTTFLYYFSFLVHCSVCLGLPWWPSGKESACNAGDLGLIPWLGRFPGGGHGKTLQYSYLENPHRQRIPVGYSPWGCTESDTTEQQSIAQHRGAGQSAFLSLLPLVDMCELQQLLTHQGYCFISVFLTSPKVPLKPTPSQSTRGKAF